jgi:hypothetical protein
MSTVSQNTFGNTPAAKYLTRELSRVENSLLSKSIGRRITSTNTAVRDLISAYESGSLSAKTFANCLRLMREEVSSEVSITLIDQLRKNVQIGLIKRGIRLCSVARKSERVLENVDNKSTKVPFVSTVSSGTTYTFTDSMSGRTFVAGIKYDGWDDTVYPSRVWLSEVDDINPEILMERSNRRCARQGKPHMEM